MVNIHWMRRPRIGGRGRREGYVYTPIPYANVINFHHSRGLAWLTPGVADPWTAGY
jgi:hypothetical protein